MSLNVSGTAPIVAGVVVRMDDHRLVGDARRSSTFSLAPVEATVRSKTLAAAVPGRLSRAGPPVRRRPGHRPGAAPACSPPGEGLTPTAPVSGFLKAIASPRARIAGSLVLKYCPPGCPAPGLPAGIVSRARFPCQLRIGLHAYGEDTMSAGTSSPEDSFTKMRLPRFSKAATPSLT
jgi:hypothetical protein